MDYREEYEAEIDLKDLLFYILRRWRSILLAAVLCCALLAGYKAVRGIGSSSGETVPQKIRNYEFELAQYELDRSAYERELQDYIELLERHRLYMEKSVLMQTDPYYMPAAAAVVFVKLDNAEWEGLPPNLGIDPTDSIIKAYTSGFLSTLDWEPIEKLTGNEKLYLEELLNISVDYNSNTFTIKVVYSDGQTAQEILDIVLEQVLSRQPDIAMGVGQHVAIVGNRALSYTIDSSLAESQKNNVSVMASYEQSILYKRMGLEELDEPEKPFVIGFVKYPVAGFVLGSFLMVAFYGAAYLLGGRLHSTESLRNRYGYVLLGTLPCPQKKRLLSGIDRFLDKLAGVPSESKEEVYRRIALNLTNLMGEQRRILLTGTVDLEKIQALTDAVSKQLEAFDLIAAADMGLNAGTLEALARCDAVLLVEEEEKSLASRIRKEHDCITALGKPVVGYVLL